MNYEYIVIFVVALLILQSAVASTAEEHQAEWLREAVNWIVPTLVVLGLLVFLFSNR